MVAPVQPESVNLVDLDAFVRVVETGSLTGAAEQLGVPKSTVSRRVARLEDALGLPLLTRSARSVTVTEDGLRLHARSAPALRQLAEVERELDDRAETPTGVLRLTTPQDLGHSTGFARLLTDFRERFPEVIVEVELTNRVLDLAAEGFDLALRPNAPSVGGGGLVGRRIATHGAGLYASPAYLARRGCPELPGSLAGHDLVHHRVLPRDRVVLRRDDDTEVELAAKSVMICNDFWLVAAAAVQGGGVAVIPEMMAEPHVERGELERLFPALSAMRGSLWVVWPEGRHLAPRVRAFVDHIVDRSGRPELWR